MVKPFVVATNAAPTFVVLATDEENAIEIAAQYYYETYGEVRDDYVAYDLVDYIQPDNIWEVF